eukprot:2742632-Pyramimonas_sp.AAC.1
MKTSCSVVSGSYWSPWSARGGDDKSLRPRVLSKDNPYKLGWEKKWYQTKGDTAAEEAAFTLPSLGKARH